jgi:hypothetical protein
MCVHTAGVKLGLSHRLRVLENRVLRRIYGPKTGEWQGLEKTA